MVINTYLSIHWNKWTKRSIWKTLGDSVDKGLQAHLHAIHKSSRPAAPSPGHAALAAHCSPHSEQVLCARHAPRQAGLLRTITGLWSPPGRFFILKIKQKSFWNRCIFVTSCELKWSNVSLGLFLHFMNTSWITQTWKTIWDQYPSTLRLPSRNKPRHAWGRKSKVTTESK